MTIRELINKLEERASVLGDNTVVSVGFMCYDSDEGEYYQSRSIQSIDTYDRTQEVVIEGEG